MRTRVRLVGCSMELATWSVCARSTLRSFSPRRSRGVLFARALSAQRAKINPESRISAARPNVGVGGSWVKALLR